MDQVGHQTKGLRGRQGGYLYQANVAVLRMISVLRREATALVLERRYSHGDDFDDIKVLTTSELHAYQVKWGMHSQADLSWAQFAGDVNEHQIDFSLEALFNTHRALSKAQSGRRVVLHVYTTRQPMPDDPLSRLLRPAEDPALLRFADGPPGCALAFDATATATLLPNLDPEDLARLLADLVVEVGQRQCPASRGQEAEGGHPMRSAIMSQLLDLGLADPPARLDLRATYERMVYLSLEQAIYGQEIAVNLLESRLQIGLDRAKVPQDFPFDSNLAVTSPLQQTLEVALRTNNRTRIFAVAGPPGSGKSWALSAFAKGWGNGSGAPIHYCFERPEGDPYLPNRAREETVVANLIAAVRTQHPRLTCFETPSYGATRIDLEHVLESLACEVALGERIPIVVDGLDHAVRTLEQHRGESFETSVLQLLRDIQIPARVAVVVSTQPVPYLHDLIKNRGDEVLTIDMPALPESGVRKLLANEGVLPDSVAIKEVVTADTLDRSRGLPLFVHYVAKSLKTIDLTDRTSVQRFFATLPRLPITRDIAEYYNYLWQAAPEHARGLMLRLAILDFAVTRQEMEEAIYPREERLGHPLIPAWQTVDPLLRTVDGAVALFHDSFRRYLLGRFDELDEADREFLAYRIVRFLGAHDHLESDRAFGYLWRYLAMAGRHEQVYAAARLAHIDAAIKVGRSAAEIRANLHVALNSAVTEERFDALCRIGFLLAYLDQRFENLGSLEFARAAGALGWDHVVQRFLNRQSYDGRDRDEFLGLLDLAAREGWTIDGKRLLDRWRRGVRRDWNDHSQIDIAAYVRAVTLWEGGRVATRWVRKTVDSGSQEHLLGEAYLVLAETGRIDDLWTERRATRSVSRRAALDCLIAAVIGRGAQLSAQTLDEARPVLANWGPSKVADLLANAGVSPSLLSTFVPLEEALFEAPEHLRFGEDATPYESVRIALRLAASGGDAVTLANAHAWLSSLPRSYLSAYAQLAVKTGVAQGTLDRGNQPDFSTVLEKLRRLMLWQDRPDTSPKAWDLWGLRRPARDLCVEAARLILLSTAANARRELLRFLESQLTEMSSTIEADDGTGFSFSIALEVTETALAPGIELADEDLVRSLCSAIEHHVRQTIGFETGRAKRLLHVARLWAAIGAQREAEQSFDLAVQASFAHGWRKDLVFFHLGSFVDALNAIDPSRQFERLKVFGELIEWAPAVTDGDETRHLPSELFSSTAAASLADAVYLLRRFEQDLDWLSYGNSLAHLIRDKRLDPAFRIALVSTVGPEIDRKRSLPAAMLAAWQDEMVSGGANAATLTAFARAHFSCAMLDGEDRDWALGTFERLASLDPLEKSDTYRSPIGYSEAEDTAALDAGIPADEFAKRIRKYSADELLTIIPPAGCFHLLQQEIETRAQDMPIAELQKLADLAAQSSRVGPDLQELIANQLATKDPPKAVSTLISAFSELRGWWPVYSKRSESLARRAVEIDPSLALAALRDNYASTLSESPGFGQSGFVVMGKALLEAGRTEAAQSLFEEIKALCIAMFRSFPPLTPAYDWLGAAADHAEPPLLTVPEHEVLARRLLVPEFEVRDLATAGVRQALQWLPEFSASLVDAFPQLTTVRARTAALVALRSTDLTALEKGRLSRHLETESRLPVLLEAQRLGLSVGFPTRATLIAVPAPHEIEATLWPAVMPIVQTEFTELARTVGLDPAELLRLIIHRIAPRWDPDRARSVEARYNHSNFEQIPFESIELREVMDEAYRWAASEFPALSIATQDFVDRLVTHDDPELQVPAYACPPAQAEQMISEDLEAGPWEVADTPWVLLAAHRSSTARSGRGYGFTEITESWIAVHARGAVPDDTSIFETVARSRDLRLTMARLRALASRDIRYEPGTNPVILLHRRSTLANRGVVLLTLNPDARQSLGLTWSGEGLDLLQGGTPAVRYVRWAKGFEADGFRRRWEDRGAVLIASPEIVAQLTAWSDVPLFTRVTVDQLQRDDQGLVSEETSTTRRTANFPLIATP